MATVRALYHYPCPDGITAALACHLFHKSKDILIELIPHTTYNPLPLNDLNLTNTDTVYLLDYSGPPGFVPEIAKRAAKCIVLDHHKTAAESLTGPTANLPSNVEVVFDMHRSGATVALDHFNLAETLPQETVSFFKYIEDGDLWRWKLPDSKAFHAGFLAQNLNLNARENPKIFDELLALTPTDLIAKGKVELERQNKLIAGALEKAYVVELGANGGTALSVDIDGELIKLRSQLGNELAAEAGKRGLQAIGVVVYKEPGMVESGNTKQVKVSLRSIGDIDTTAVSQAFGGGGHRNASSFLIEEEEFKKWKCG